MCEGQRMWYGACFPLDWSPITTAGGAIRQTKATSHRWSSTPTSRSACPPCDPACWVCVFLDYSKGGWRLHKHPHGTRFCSTALSLRCSEFYYYFFAESMIVLYRRSQQTIWRSPLDSRPPVCWAAGLSRCPRFGCLFKAGEWYFLCFIQIADFYQMFPIESFIVRSCFCTKKDHAASANGFLYGLRCVMN